MFYFDLDELADTCSGCSQIPYDEIPLHITVLLELILEEIIICVADYIFEKVLLLDFHRLQMQLFFCVWQPAVRIRGSHRRRKAWIRPKIRMETIPMK